MAEGDYRIDAHERVFILTDGSDNPMMAVFHNTKKRYLMVYQDPFLAAKDAEERDAELVTLEFYQAVAFAKRRKADNVCIKNSDEDLGMPVQGGLGD